MSDFAIQVNGLSKAYRIGLKQERNDTMGAAVATWMKSPAANFKRLRNLSRFDLNKPDDPDTFWALRDISFTLNGGDILGIIGRNGAGKSTLLKVLSKITDPTYGEIRIRGRVASLLEVGTGFNPELTGRENTFLNGTILGMTRKEVSKKFDEIVAFSGVEKFIDTPVKRYSSGMKVRLGFAVAAHLEPEILIVDEVLAVGDADFQKKCIGKMQGISQEEGRTVLFVSHDMSAIGAICRNCLLLERGQVDMIGDTASVVHKYTKNITDQGLDTDLGNHISLQVEELNAEELVVRARIHIKVKNFQDNVFYIRIYDGSNSELVFYREKGLVLSDGDELIVKIDVSSLKGGYYTIQARYMGSRLEDLKNRIAIHSDYVPIMYVKEDTVKYDLGIIAPRIQIHNLTTGHVV